MIIHFTKGIFVSKYYPESLFNIISFYITRETATEGYFVTTVSYRYARLFGYCFQYL